MPLPLRRLIIAPAAVGCKRRNGLRTNVGVGDSASDAGHKFAGSGGGDAIVSHLAGSRCSSGPWRGAGEQRL